MLLQGCQVFAAERWEVEGERVRRARPTSGSALRGSAEAGGVPADVQDQPLAVFLVVDGLHLYSRGLQARLILAKREVNSAADLGIAAPWALESRGI